MDTSWQNAKEIEIPKEALKQTLEDDVSLSNKLYSFVNKSPFLVAGVTGFVIVSGIGIYKWKTRTIPPSLFLMQLRIAAQGTVVGCLTLGMAYQMYKDFIQKKK